MKALRAGVCLLIAFSGVPGFASEPGADVDPLSGVTGLLAQEHQHSRTSTPPLSLTELEAATLTGLETVKHVLRQMFPHFAEGAGYSMQFILFGRAASGTISFFDQAGNPASLAFR